MRLQKTLTRFLFDVTQLLAILNVSNNILPCHLQLNNIETLVSSGFRYENCAIVTNKITEIMTQLEDEIWLPIPEFEQKYMISNFGNIRGLNRVTIRSNGKGITTKARAMKPMMSTTGYYYIHGFDRNNKRKTLRHHRLVALCFIDKVEGKLFVNHKDGNKLNNHYSNLEWCTRAENNLHACRTGLRNKKRKKFLSSKSRAVTQYDLNGNKIREHDSIAHAAQENNISTACIYQVLNGGCKQTHGFVFKLAA